MRAERRGDHQRLVTTFVAAHAVGVSGCTLQRWAAARRVEPAQTLPSGQHQWRITELAGQLAALHAAT